MCKYVYCKEFINIIKLSIVKNKYIQYNLIYFFIDIAFRKIRKSVDKSLYRFEFGDLLVNIIL